MDCSVTGGREERQGLRKRDKETECRRGGTGSERVRGEGERRGGVRHMGGMKGNRKLTF